MSARWSLPVSLGYEVGLPIGSSLGGRDCCAVEREFRCAISAIKN